MATDSTLYYVLLFIVIVFQRIPQDDIPTDRPLASVCQYDCRVLCPECFPLPPRCDELDRLFTLHGGSFFNRINGMLNAHTTRIGAFREPTNQAVLKHLNRDSTIEKLLEQFCDSYKQPKAARCTWARNGSVEEAKQFLQQSILDDTRIEGCIFCPTTSSGQTLQRFLALLDPTDNALRNLLAVRTNVEPLLLKLFATHDTSSLYVPKLLDMIGFTVIESYEGQTLEHYYDQPLAIRLLIAAKLIQAAFSFTEGIHGFRFYLTDINPDNVVVKVDHGNSNVRVSIVDLDNVIILDSLAGTFSSQHAYHVHGKIECNGCFAYVQEDVCRYRSSDLNLFATCQLLLENLNGNYAAGLLHSGHSKSKDQSLTDPYDDAPQILHNLLEECVHCQPPNCRNRSLILHDMLEIIDRTVAQL
uniref:PIP49_C domain-containing protein n=1 Tax=Anopheles stephensi TaxID=30069 RepID=A0A182YE53_ANOST